MSDSRFSFNFGPAGHAAVASSVTTAAVSSLVRPVLLETVMGPAIALGLPSTAVVVGVGLVAFGLCRLLGDLLD